MKGPSREALDWVGQDLGSCPGIRRDVTPRPTGSFEAEESIPGLGASCNPHPTPTPLKCVPWSLPCRYLGAEVLSQVGEVKPLPGPLGRGTCWL